MSRTRRSRAAFAASRDAVRAIEIAVVAPQVIAMRMAGIAAAGAQPDGHHQRELVTMWTEKTQAFTEAWMAVIVESWTYSSRLGAAMMASAPYGLPFAWTPMPNVLGRALVPVHRTVLANHRRLSRRRRA